MIIIDDLTVSIRVWMGEYFMYLDSLKESIKIS